MNLNELKQALQDEQEMQREAIGNSANAWADKELQEVQEHCASRIKYLRAEIAKHTGDK